MKQLATCKPGIVSGNTKICRDRGEVLIMRIVDKTNNMFSGEKNVVPGDVLISVVVTENTKYKPVFNINEIVSIDCCDVMVEPTSPIELVKRDILTNSKLYSIIEEAKFLYNKYV